MLNKIKSNFYAPFHLYLREVRRFTITYNQTLIGPVLSSLMYLLIFFLILRSNNNDASLFQKMHLISIGMMVNSVVNAAFNNVISSLIIAKVVGYINDIIVVPISTHGIIFAYVSASLTRSLFVGGIFFLILNFFFSFTLYHPFLLVFYFFFSCSMLSMLGLIAGCLCNTFEQSSSINNYFITPLSLLSCTFFSVNELSSTMQFIVKLNPFFYFIDGFKYVFVNHADSNIGLGILLMCIVNFLLYFLSNLVLHRGIGIKN